MFNGVVDLKNTKLKYQVSLFGDYSEIKPTEETLKKCLEKFFFLGFIPGSSVQELDQQTGRMEPRLTLQSMRNGIAVNFLNGRIDVMAIPLPGSPAAALDFTAFIESATAAVKCSIETLGISFGRLGIVSETFVGEFSKEHLVSIRDKFIVRDSVIFPEMEMTEWQSRSVLKETVGRLNNHAINTTYNVAQVHIQMGDANGVKEFDTIHLTVDINTPGDQVVPGTLDFFANFVEYSLRREKEVQIKIGALLNEIQ
jgi:hypothetical protein